jgi:hypothetical protein
MVVAGVGEACTAAVVGKAIVATAAAVNVGRGVSVGARVAVAWSAAN